MVPSVRPVDLVRCPRTFWPRWWRTPLVGVDHLHPVDVPASLHLQVVADLVGRLTGVEVVLVVSEPFRDLVSVALHEVDDRVDLVVLETAERCLAVDPRLLGDDPRGASPMPFMSVRARSTLFVPSRSVCPIRTK